MGFERQFATNYLGPFALTGLLLPSIKQIAGSRVVTVSSSANKQGRIEFDNLQSERVYKPMIQAVCAIQVGRPYLFAELQRRLKAAGSPILSTAAHPGYAGNNLQADHIGLGLKTLITMMKPFVSQRRGARSATNAVCGGCCGGRSWRLLRAGRHRGTERASDCCCRFRKVPWTKRLRPALDRIRAP